MTSRALGLTVLLLLLTGMGAAAQSTSGAQPPLRPLGPIVARAQTAFGSVEVLQLNNGRLIVNDPGHRQLVLVDSSFATVAVISDTGGTARRYTARQSHIIRYLGDSTLFVDGTALAILVIDPLGAIARIVSIPRPSDAYNLMTPNAWGMPGINAQGRLVYQVFPAYEPPGAYTSATAIPAEPDSAPLVRADLATHTLDTLVRLKMRTDELGVRTTGSDGAITLTTTVHPFQLADDWAVTTDGSIAIVRARDFHIDWINPNGSMTSTGKIPYDWHRLSDSAKVALADSVRDLHTRSQAARVGAASSSNAVHQEFVAADPSDVPDYPPAFIPRGTWADMENNIWVQINLPGPVSGGPVYDVINRRGELIDQVQVPGGCAVVGFGVGTVYLQSRDGRTLSFVRARIR